MEIERRAFLRCAATVAVTLFGPTVTRAFAAGEPRYLSACRLADGRYAVAEFDPTGLVLRTMPLPDRGHGFAVAADRTRAVAFGRHPFTFAVAFSVGGSDAPVVFAAPPGRHFYGHGVFAAGGRLLLATENDFDNGRGVIGVYDVAAAYRRIGEFDSRGVGPHELVMLPDGRTIAVANGGIETHPDAGDAKLNLSTMSPSLTFMDAGSGDVIADHRLDGSLHQLSIRHLAIDAAGAVWFGCQYEGSATDQPPLLGRAGIDFGPIMVEEAADVRLSMQNYIGSVAANRDGSIIAASSPRGGRILLIDTSGRVLRSAEITDGCGIVRLGEDGFIATSGMGVVAAVAGDASEQLATDAVSFDNHVAPVFSAA